MRPHEPDGQFLQAPERFWNQFRLDVVAGRGDVEREQPVRAYTRAGREAI